jgi:hypothetical protein
MTEEPKIDCWMIPLLKASVKMNLTKANSVWGIKYVNEQRVRKNKYNPIGQLQIIMDRLNELQEFYDNQIKEGLDK